jgi:hypothetical protein
MRTRGFTSRVRRGVPRRRSQTPSGVERLLSHVYHLVPGAYRRSADLAERMERPATLGSPYPDVLENIHGSLRPAEFSGSHDTQVHDA